MRFHASLLVKTWNSSQSKRKHSQFPAEKCIFHFDIALLIIIILNKTGSQDTGYKNT